MALQDVQTDENGDRVYIWDDGSFPSVTTILKCYEPKQRAIEGFKESHPNPIQYRDRQGLVGSCVHHRILNNIALRHIDPPYVDPDHMDADTMLDIETAVAMWDQVDIDPGNTPRVEIPLRHPQHGYAGRCDLLTDDGLVTDLKISGSIHDSYKMQVAAYYHAIKYMPDYPDPTGAAIVSLAPKESDNPTLSPHTVRLDEQTLTDWFDVFLDCLVRFNDRPPK